MVEDTVVVTDNMDLPPGALRLKRGGRNRAHRGIASVLDTLGCEQFLRLYIGIGRPSSGKSVVDHVLSKPEREELAAVRDAISTAAAALVKLAESNPEEVMNDLNRRG